MTRAVVGSKVSWMAKRNVTLLFWGNAGRKLCPSGCRAQGWRGYMGVGGRCGGCWATVQELDGAPHVPVLLAEVLDAFKEVKLERMVDGTLGAGGHSSALAQNHPEMGCLIGFDKDPVAHELAKEKMHCMGFDVMPLIEGSVVDDDGGRGGGERIMIPVHRDFSGMRDTVIALKEKGWIPDDSVDGILLDLGVSSMQIDTDERGFSFMNDGPLDMRMDPRSMLTAEVAVNTWSESRLGKIFKEYGEERYWRSIARKIVEKRVEKRIQTTRELVEIIGQPGGFHNAKWGKKQGKQKHPATRVFQSLRIAVNEELNSLGTVIPEAIQRLRPGGRLAIITFHSLEDRLVKWAFRQAAGMAPSDNLLPDYCLPFDPTEEPMIKIITRKPICPSDEEEGRNVRSRSAKLRIVERL